MLSVRIKLPLTIGPSLTFLRIAAAGLFAESLSLRNSKQLTTLPPSRCTFSATKVLRMSGGEGESVIPPDDGKVRRKMDVGEGRSMLHWQRLKVPVERKNKITMEEVAKHNKDGDSWTVFHGKVYDTTAFYDFHPGGRPYMKMVAGKDGTELFNKYHAYVNLDFMMSKCFVGPLVQPGEDAPANISEDQELSDDEDEFEIQARKNAEANAATSQGKSFMDEMD